MFNLIKHDLIQYHLLACSDANSAGSNPIIAIIVPLSRTGQFFFLPEILIDHIVVKQTLRSQIRRWNIQCFIRIKITANEVLSMFQLDTETHKGHETLHWTRQINTFGTSTNIKEQNNEHQTHMPTQMGTKLTLKQYGRQKHVTKLHNGEEHYRHKGAKKH